MVVRGLEERFANLRADVSREAGSEIENDGHSAHPKKISGYCSGAGDKGKLGRPLAMFRMLKEKNNPERRRTFFDIW